MGFEDGFRHGRILWRFQNAATIERSEPLSELVEWPPGGVVEWVCAGGSLPDPEVRPLHWKPVFEAPATADGFGIQKSVDLSLGGVAPERVLPGTGERGRCVGRTGELLRDRVGLATALEHERHRGVAGVKLRLHRFEHRSGRAAAQEERAVDRLDDRALA